MGMVDRTTACAPSRQRSGCTARALTKVRDGGGFVSGSLSCAWSTQSARDARCFNGKNLRTHVVDQAMRLPAPHDGTPMFGPSFSTLSEQGRGTARHLDFGRGRNRSGSSRTCSSCRPEHMSCSHHVQGPACATAAAGNALLRTQQAPWQRRLDVARHRHCKRMHE